VVILMLDTKLEPAIAKDMVKGAPDLLWSEFHLGYNMLLNLLRAEGADPEGLMRRSYRQFQTERQLPQLQLKAQAKVRRRGFRA
jgi:ATP-dependent RNA helicase DOB1